MRKRITILAGLAMAVAMSIAVATSSAHSIDYLTASISPAANFNGNSGNFTLANPVSTGTTISFSLTISINQQGNTTTYPRTITFGANNGSNAPATLSPSQCTFANANDTCTLGVQITAPATPGNYHVKIKDIDGTGGRNGLVGGDGVLVHFTVAGGNSGCPSTPATTGLTVDKVCAVLHDPTAVTLRATLKAGTTALAGQTINFTVDGVGAGSGLIDGNGVATTTYDASGLSVGSHDIIASYDGDGCIYSAAEGSNVLGITYGQVRFQQPINADGSSVFKSVRTIPVKILVTDALGAPVTNAEAYVFFAKYTNNILGDEYESLPLANTNNDSGNLMRLSDATIGQYIFNWNTTGLENGTYRVRVELGEGSCAPPRVVDLSFKRK